MNNMFSKAAIWVVIALVLFTVFKQFDERGLAGGATPIPYSDFLDEVKSQRIREATIEDRTASARLRWLVSPAEAMNLEEPTVRVRTFGITGGRAYPWVLDLRVPSVREFIDPGGERP